MNLHEFVVVMSAKPEVQRRLVEFIGAWVADGASRRVRVQAAFPVNAGSVTETQASEARSRVVGWKSQEAFRDGSNRVTYVYIVDVNQAFAEVNRGDWHEWVKSDLSQRAGRSGNAPCHIVCIGADQIKGVERGEVVHVLRVTRSELIAHTMTLFSGPGQAFDPRHADAIVKAAEYLGAAERSEDWAQLFGSGLAAWFETGANAALSHFDRALAALGQPRTDVVVCNRAYVQLWRATVLREAERYGPALLALDDAIECAGKAKLELLGDMRIRRGHLLDDLNEGDPVSEYAAAYKALDDFNAGTEYAVALAKANRLPDALAVLDTVEANELEKEDRRVLRRLRGVVYLAMARYRGAHEEFSQVIEEDPEDARAHVGRALTCRSMHLSKDALSDLDRAATLLYDRLALVEHVRALAHIDNRDFELALPCIRRVLETPVKAYDDSIKAEAEILKGLVLSQRGEWRRAVNACRHGIAQGARSERSYAILAWLLHRSDRLGEAEREVRRAVEMIHQSGTYPSVWTWPVHLTAASVLTTCAERESDAVLAHEALEATFEAEDDLWLRREQVLETSQALPDIKLDLDEPAALNFFERARAWTTLGNPVDARRALELCGKHTRRGSEVNRFRRRATRSLKSLNQPPTIPWPAIVIVALTLIIGAIMLLLLDTNLNASKLTAIGTLVLGVTVIALAAYTLPTLTQLRVGAVELRRAISESQTQTVLEAVGPPPPPPAPVWPHLHGSPAPPPPPNESTQA
jgi:tetratricopeptide (TPR) repeat protein